MNPRKRIPFGLLLVLGAPMAAAADSETFTLTASVMEASRSVAVAFSQDGSKVVLALEDGGARLKDTAGGEGLFLKWDGKPAHSVVFSPDGARIATLGFDGVRVWDVASGRPVAQFTDPKTSLPVAAFSPDGSRIVLVIGPNEGKARVLDIATAREIAVLEGHEAGIYDAAYSSDGAQIATASADDTVRLWDAGSGREIARFRKDGVRSVAFSHDGKRLATGAGDGSAHVFDVATGRETLVLKIETDDAIAASFSRDGTRIVTGSRDHTVRIWDAASGAEIARLTDPLCEVTSAAFSPDGDRILSTAWCGIGRIWTRQPGAKMPDGVAGLWAFNGTAPDDPPDLASGINRVYCVTSPFNIHEDGLIVSFVQEGFDLPPEAKMHLRCAADLSCQVFAGPPAQGAALADTAKLTIAGKGGELCVGSECTVIARCPPITWTDEEKASGFAAAWEKQVLGKPSP